MKITSYLIFIVIIMLASEIVSSGGVKLIVPGTKGKLSSIAIDSKGNILVGGSNSVSRRDSNYFLNKFSPVGDKLMELTWGTSEFEYVSSIISDANDDIYFSGYVGASSPRAVIASADTSGHKRWLVELSASGSSSGCAIDIGTNSSLYMAGTVTGEFAGTTSHGGQDVFITGFAPEGKQLWIRLYGSTGNDFVNYFGDALVTSAEKGIIVGCFTDGNWGGKNSGLHDITFLRVSVSDAVELTTIKGTPDEDYSTGSEANADGGVYVVGRTNGQLEPGVNHGGFDSFIMEFAVENGSMLWVRQFGGVGDDAAFAVSAQQTPGGYAYVVGATLQASSSSAFYAIFSQGSLLSQSSFHQHQLLPGDVEFDGDGQIFVCGIHLLGDSGFLGVARVGTFA